VTVSAADAERRIRAFVDEPDFAVITGQPRIILGAEEFPPGLTATVLWLRSFGPEISCVRLRPYHVDGRLLLDSSVLIRLPRAPARPPCPARWATRRRPGGSRRS
jgi:hypothetical protein